VVDHARQAGDTTLGAHEVIAGLLYCRIEQKLVPALNGDKGLKLTAANFTIILAYGEFDLAADLKIHTDLPVASHMPVDIMYDEYGELNAPQPEPEEDDSAAHGLRLSAALLLFSLALTQ